jgi:type VI secretion system protein VasJ
MNLESIRELGKKAIPGEFPAGRDVRELEGFLALQGEIDRSQSISASGAVDWKKVEKLSEELLDREGKDLLVACYLSVALTRTGGPPGFLAGIKVMADLVEDYWETLFPPLKRRRGRRNASSWWL